MARKWQKLAAIHRRRISFPTRDNEDENLESCSTSKVVSKGHLVVYSADRRRFVIPSAYLNNDIFRKLLEASEEEFGLPMDGPITLPCDADFAECILSLTGRGSIGGDLQKAWLLSITTACCSSSSSYQKRRNDQLLVH